MTPPVPEQGGHPAACNWCKYHPARRGPLSRNCGNANGSLLLECRHSTDLLNPRLARKVGVQSVAELTQLWMEAFPKGL